MRKISGTVQRRNDEQVGILGPDLHTASLPVGEDHYSDGDQRGLGTRMINRLSAGVYNDHFRTGVIPSGYTWQGAPFAGTPGVNYSLSLEYMGMYNTGAARNFLSTPVTNAPSAWQHKSFYARAGARYNGLIGVRLDDGTDNNYAEIALDGRARNGAQTLVFRSRVGGGAVTTATSSFVSPVDALHVLRLYVYYDGSTYTVYGYPFPEEGIPTNVINFNKTVAWIPCAGRVGIVFETSGGSNPSVVDWIKNEFG